MIKVVSFSNRQQVKLYIDGVLRGTYKGEKGLGALTALTHLQLYGKIDIQFVSE